MDIIGQKIKNVRHMTKKEYEYNGWEPNGYDPPMVIVLEDGTCLYPSQDYEGKGPGAIFGHSPKEKDPEKKFFVLYIDKK